MTGTPLQQAIVVVAVLVAGVGLGLWGLVSLAGRHSRPSGMEGCMTSIILFVPFAGAGFLFFLAAQV